MPVAAASPPPEIQETARSLADAMRALVDAIPGGPHRPTALGEQLGLSRVTVSKLLGALQRPSLVEVLEAIPGPESLRTAAEASRGLGVDPAIVDDALGAIDGFGALIRDRFGTRAALHAAIGGRSSELRPRIEQAGRADVFKGMRQVLGAEANAWLTAMIFAPAPDGETVEVTTIHGALGLRRLRPDTPIFFTFGPPGPQQGSPDGERDLSASPVSLQEFYANDPATLESSIVGGQLRHRLVQDRLGKDAVVDMLAVSHNPRGSRRYAPPEAPRRGVSVFVDVPVRTMIADVIVHRDLFPGAEPELIVYNPGARGPANPNDPTRDLDRVAVSETIATIPDEGDRFAVPEIPNYGAMVRRVFAQLGAAPGDYRVHRVTMAYPVTAFQHVIAFKAPPAPG